MMQHWVGKKGQPYFIYEEERDGLHEGGVVPPTAGQEVPLLWGGQYHLEDTKHTINTI